MAWPGLYPGRGRQGSGQKGLPGSPPGDIVHNVRITRPVSLGQPPSGSNSDASRETQRPLFTGTCPGGGGRPVRVSPPSPLIWGSLRTGGWAWGVTGWDTVVVPISYSVEDNSVDKPWGVSSPQHHPLNPGGRYDQPGAPTSGTKCKTHPRSLGALVLNSRVKCRRQKRDISKIGPCTVLPSPGCHLPGTEGL